MKKNKTIKNNPYIGDSFDDYLKEKLKDEEFKNLFEIEKMKRTINKVKDKEIENITTKEIECMNFGSKLQLHRGLIRTGLIDSSIDENLCILCKKWEKLNIKRIKDKNYPKEIEDNIFLTQKIVEALIDNDLKEQEETFMVGDENDIPKGLFTCS